LFPDAGTLRQHENGTISPVNSHRERPMRFANQMSTPASETAGIPRASFAIHGVALARRAETRSLRLASSPAIRRPMIENGGADHGSSLRAASAANAPWRPIAAAISWVAGLVLDGFAEYGEAMYPCFDKSAATARSEREDLSQSGAVRAVSHGGESRSASPFLKFWSAMCRKRESRRISAAWEVLDDRTLKDIGISRYEIECFARSEPAGRQGDPHR
jgi:uncharacterized protein YjiS (DUF1127 family)